MEKQPHSAMTKVVINPGICGFTASIEVSRAFKRRVSINITSDCEQVAKPGESLTEVNSWDVLKARGDSEVDMQSSKDTQTNPIESE